MIVTSMYEALTMCSPYAQGSLYMVKNNLYNLTLQSHCYCPHFIDEETALEKLSCSQPLVRGV